MVSNFNLVFTNEDIIKQIIKYTKKPRQYYIRYKLLDEDADQLIHIALKFYKMDENEYSHLYEKVFDYVESSIVNRNVRFGKIINEIPKPLKEKGKNCYGGKYEIEHITNWIKQNYRYMDNKNLDDLRENYFDGEEKRFHEYAVFCIKCKEYGENNHKEDHKTIGRFECKWSICDECFFDECYKTNGIFDKMFNKEFNKFKKLKIKNNKIKKN